jgi:hypothetical protein
MFLTQHITQSMANGLMVDTLMTLVMTRDYLVTTQNDITDNPCDDIDDL